MIEREEFSQPVSGTIVEQQQKKVEKEMAAMTASKGELIAAN